MFDPKDPNSKKKTDEDLHDDFSKFFEKKFSELEGDLDLDITDDIPSLSEDLHQTIEENPDIDGDKEVRAFRKRHHHGIFSSDKAKYGLRVGLVLATLTMVGGAAWFSFSRKESITDVANLPLVKAEKEALVKQPDHPGGLQVPYTDKEVYQTLKKDSEKELPKVERILHNDDIFAAHSDKDLSYLKEITGELLPESTETTSNSATKTASPTLVDNTKKVEEAPKELNVALTTPSRKEQTRSISEKDLKTPKPSAKKPVEALNVPYSMHGYRVQIGAFRSQEEAIGAWGLLKKRHGNLFTQMNYHIERADLGDKGVFFRLQTNSYPDQADARTVCKKLQDKHESCFVVRAR